MHGHTPQEKLKATTSLLHTHVLLLEGVLRTIGSFTQFLRTISGGHYVYTTCRNENFSR